MKPVKVIAVSGGKGGVGKTNVSVNLSLALAARDRRVVLMDADLGLANVDLLLGIKPNKTLHDVISGQCDLRDVMIESEGIRVVPAASGIQRMSQLDPMEHSGLVQAFSEIGDDMDVLIIDTAAGISDSVITFVRAAQEILLVVCDEPSSITDAYALMKILNKEHGMTRFRVVANMARSPKEAQNIYNKLLTVSERFLDVTLKFEGLIPFDENLRKAVQKQQPVLRAAPRSPAANAFRLLADKVDNWPVASGPRGHLEFFVERLLAQEFS